MGGPPREIANAEAERGPNGFEQKARIGATIPSDHIVQVVAAGVDE